MDKQIERLPKHTLGDVNPALAVKENHAAVGRTALIAKKIFGPFGSGQLRIRQKIDGTFAGAAELPLASEAVGVTVAALADVIGLQGNSGLD
jgi:hypothetical protein